MAVLTRRVAVLALLVTCAAAGPPQDKKQAFAAFQKVTDRVKSEARVVGARMSKVMKPAWPGLAKGVHRRVPPHGRRLSTGPQCEWSGSSCSPDAEFTASIYSNASAEMKTLVANMQVCEGYSTALSCAQATAPQCVWDFDYDKCTFDIKHTQALAVGTSDCGWMGAQMMAESQCELAATETECGANANCVFEDSFRPSGAVGTLCTQTEECQLSPGADITVFMCGEGFDEEAASLECAAAVDFDEARIDEFILCLTEKCPVYGELVEVAAVVCADLSEEACNSNEKCLYEDSICNPDFDAVMWESLPAGCPMRDAQALFMTCGEKEMSQCTGQCDWMKNWHCDDSEGPTVYEEASCEPSLATMAEIFAQAGNNDAQAVLTAELVSQNCRAQQTSSDCQDAVYQTTATTSAFKLKLKLKVKGKRSMKALLKIKISNGLVEAKAKIKAGRRRG